MFWAHIWGISFLHEHETWTGIVGSFLLLGGVVTVSSSKAKAAQIGPDDTTAFVTGVESKAPDYEDTRITLGDGLSVERDDWQRIPDNALDRTTSEVEVEMDTRPKQMTSK